MGENILEDIKRQTREIVTEFLETARMESGQILAVGCSSSEILGCRIGSHSSEDVGRAVFRVISEETGDRGIFLAAQCCEHLNRALIMEREAAERYGYEPVNVVPQLKAGGSFATAAYAGFKDPVAVESVRAHGGIDIGDTLIGMHLRPVAVPVRTSIREIGSAHVNCARTRLKFIGGARAVYDPELV